MQASEELEDRESLAVMAASGLQDDEPAGDGETFIEKYTRGVSAVETILTLDLLRQSVAIKELLNNAAIRNRKQGVGGSNNANNKGSSENGNSAFMRKTVSVPNFSHVSCLNDLSLSVTLQGEGYTRNCYCCLCHCYCSCLSFH